MQYWYKAQKSLLFYFQRGKVKDRTQDQIGILLTSVLKNTKSMKQNHCNTFKCQKQ